MPSAGRPPVSPTAQLGGATRKRLAAIFALALAVFLLVASVLIWDRAFRAPASEPLPLPDGLIAVQSPAGQELLAESGFVADYRRLHASFESQIRPAYCGVASSVIALNALRSAGPRLNQATFFTDAASQVRNPLRVSLVGMSLTNLADLLRAHGADVTVFHASDTDTDAFRTLAQKNLKTPGDFLLVNYQRAELGQVEMGHISPVAAYNAEVDRLLILDVAAHKYPPVWVATETLWHAMSAPAGDSGRTRGFLVVREGKRQGQ